MIKEMHILTKLIFFLLLIGFVFVMGKNCGESNIYVESEITERNTTASVITIDSLKNIISGLEIEPITIIRTNTIRVADTTEISRLRERLRNLDRDVFLFIDVDSQDVEIYIAEFDTVLTDTIILNGDEQTIEYGQIQIDYWTGIDLWDFRFMPSEFLTIMVTEKTTIVKVKKLRFGAVGSVLGSEIYGGLWISHRKWGVQFQGGSAGKMFSLMREF